MILTIDLTPEEEARLQQAAARRGMKADAYLRSLIPMETENDMPLPKRRPKSPSGTTNSQEQQQNSQRRTGGDTSERRPSARGKYAGLMTSSEEFARQKQEEIALEERHWKTRK